MLDLRPAILTILLVASPCWAGTSVHIPPGGSVVFNGAEAIWPTDQWAMDVWLQAAPWAADGIGFHSDVLTLVCADIECVASFALAGGGSVDVAFEHYPISQYAMRFEAVEDAAGLTVRMLRSGKVEHSELRAGATMPPMLTPPMWTNISTADHAFVGRIRLWNQAGVDDADSEQLASAFLFWPSVPWAAPGLVAAWEAVVGDEIIEPLGGPPGSFIGASEGPPICWVPSDQRIFSDGFESGDLGAW